MKKVEHGQSSGMVPEDVVNKVTGIVTGVQQTLVLLRAELEQQRDMDRRERQADREARNKSAEYIHREMENLIAGQQQLLKLAVDGAARLGKLEAGQAAQATQLNTLAEQQDEFRSKVSEYMAASKREEFEQRLRRLEERTQGPDISAEQRQRYFEIFMRMARDYEAAHPEEVNGDADR